jgi:tagatose-1,6-bisphosphate aldolase non-catalytic subunit AgaZ/GatZ
MGQGFAPPATSNLMQSSPMMGRNPNTYQNYMQGADQTRIAESQFNTPRQMNMQPQMMNPQHQMAMMQNMSNVPSFSLNPYLPQNQQQLSGGLASLPGAAQFGKGIV